VYAYFEFSYSVVDGVIVLQTSSAEPEYAGEAYFYWWSVASCILMEIHAPVASGTAYIEIMYGNK
jgi:hypothetical protein